MLTWKFRKKFKEVPGRQQPSGSWKKQINGFWVCFFFVFVFWFFVCLFPLDKSILALGYTGFPKFKIKPLRACNKRSSHRQGNKPSWVRISRNSACQISTLYQTSLRQQSWCTWPCLSYTPVTALITSCVSSDQPHAGAPWKRPTSCLYCVLLPSWPTAGSAVAAKVKDPSQYLHTEKPHMWGNQCPIGQNFGKWEKEPMDKLFLTTPSA